MGLDRDDAIVRRRMQQKIEFLFQDIVSIETPTDDILQSHLNENSKNFLTQAKFSFRQIYFNASKRGTSLDKEIKHRLAELSI